MSDEGFRISWAGHDDPAAFANIIQLTETVCTPFAIRQFHLLGLLPPTDTHPRILDNACGSGRQAEVLREAYADGGKEIDITCCDLSPEMISVVKQRIEKGNWDNVKAQVVDAQELDFPPDSFTHAYMSFGIMFPDDTTKVLERLSAALVPGAPVSFSFWKESGMWILMHKAAILATSDPTFPPPKFYHPKWLHSETLVSYLERGGFKDIKISEHSHPWIAQSKTAFGKSISSTPLWTAYTKDWTAEQKEKYHDCLFEVLDESYPEAEHGPIEIPMTAYIGVARKA